MYIFIYTHTCTYRPVCLGHPYKQPVAHFSWGRAGADDTKRLFAITVILTHKA